MPKKLSFLIVVNTEVQMSDFETDLTKRFDADIHVVNSKGFNGAALDALCNAYSFVMIDNQKVFPHASNIIFTGENKQLQVIANILQEIHVL